MVEIVEELGKCEYRRSLYTPDCGGSTYWYCNRDTKQINVYEDCKNCKEAER